MKSIVISNHAALGMLGRGASETEVREAVLTGEWTSAKKNRLQSRKTFTFNGISPVNGKQYVLKTVEAVFVDEPNAITVVTVKVYYHDQ